MDIEKFIQEVEQNNLKNIVQSISIPRHGWYNYEVLSSVANFVEEKFREYGYIVEINEFSYNGKEYKNIIATLKGINSNKDWLLIGAHYDSAIGSPGADDNASGIAVMLEVARIIRKSPIAERIKFVAFTLEEPQAFDLKFIIGSSQFVKKFKKLGHRYKALILESVGYYSDVKGSQKLPAFTKGPDVGNFLGVVGNGKSNTLLELFEKVKEYVPSINLITYKAPMNGWLALETRFSDHAPFWDAGFQAVMLTDTAMFRNPYYHTSQDTPDKLNFPFMEDVTKALLVAVLISPA
ncbi:MULTISPECIES: M28 family peptidase [Thermodesulfovibrio]|uniref:Peptidase, M28 family n=1 Tax=Thermodesulfovibrio yellowstonii (strain ATCC 51303 / DSM 11347 / YP87) TaxID=289376 RepID=B5YJF7_THEYD|nr:MULTISPECIES: M28 family peptidase [Thermodesulfovibrio]ACI22003.1 peptidase, M28 family [Thermodesulfovibrio yellowstonii DSM 11347]MBC7188946.1 M28 family peptidase [Candidatus Aerophobetes bacterium]MDI6864375.1 M28 family peptidase [Thermodesulfovibrio yellowstonii]